MRRPFLSIFCLVIFLSTASGPMVLADDEAVGAVFLNEGMGARATAMAGAFVAVPQGSNMVFWNPAALTRQRTLELMVTHTEYIQGLRNEYLTFSLPLGQDQAVGFNTYFSYINSLEKLTSLNDIPTTFGVYDIYFTAAWAYRFQAGQGLGVGLKGIYQRIDEFTSWSGAVDMGYVISDFMVDNLTLGATLKNLGLPVKFITTAYWLPMTLSLGASYRFWDDNLLCSFAIQKPYQQELIFSLGAEYTLEDTLYLRAGYKYSQFGNDLGLWSSFSFGLGAEISDYKLDYSYTPFGDLGDVHRFSITLPFGQNMADEEKIIRRLEKQLKNKQNNVVNNYLEKGNSSQRNHDYDKAIVNYEKAMVLAPDRRDIQNKLNHARVKRREVQIASFIHTGKSAYKKHEYITALIEFNKAKEIDGHNKKVTFWLDKTNAQLVKEQVLFKGNKEVAKDFKTGLYNLNNGRYQDAISAWKRILRKDPRNQQVISYLNRTNQKLKEEIKDLLDQANTLWVGDEKPEAVKCWRRVLSLDSDNSTANSALTTNREQIETLAEALYKSGVQNYVNNRLVDAIANWTYVLMLEPHHDKAKKNLARAKDKVKELESLQTVQ